ncbi:MAG: NADH-quinone oxidoreductase subunit [Solirubrobacteraceae bacterium]|nr:NADH-quinone oxidoreductase subunit [Solirubrobacteraceae bacterium]
MTPKAPYIDWAALSPFVALAAGAIVTLMVGLFRSRVVRTWVVPGLTVVSFGAAIGLSVWQWGTDTAVVSGALAIDDLSLGLTILFCAGGIVATLLALGSAATEDAGHGEFHSLLLSSVMGMVVLAGAQDLISLFLGFELLSIPLYVLCASELRRATSLESGLKYLIVGSVGSATLVYGLAFIYGATGTTSFGAIARSLDATGTSSDVLLLTGVALTLTGLAFKASVAPFHQWTPDVYEGAPTAVTGFMAVATKAAAFGVILRLFDVALLPAAATWAPIMSVLAVITIIVGNVGALGQSSLKRMLAYSSVAQAGYMLAGVVVTTSLGVAATAFYLAVYLLMNLAAFSVIAARERETGLGDDLSSLNGLGASRPALAWTMSIAMLALAGFPATAGFFGKVYLIDAAVNNGYGWLSVAIVLGSAMSLAYYLRVVAAVWVRDEPRPAALTPGGQPVMAGASADGPPVARASHPFAVFTGVLCAAATIFFGIFPQPLFDVAQDAGRALASLL